MEMKDENVFQELYNFLLNDLKFINVGKSHVTAVEDNFMDVSAA